MRPRSCGSTRSAGCCACSASSPRCAATSPTWTTCSTWRPAGRAHRYVAHVIRLAGGLLETGAAYQRGGGVYFPGAGVAEAAGLGRPAALALSGEFGGRPGDPAKDDPLDVAVWQVAEPGHPAWD